MRVEYYSTTTNGQLVKALQKIAKRSVNIHLEFKWISSMSVIFEEVFPGPCCFASFWRPKRKARLARQKERLPK